jgi:hypothetical protein
MSFKEKLKNEILPRTVEFYNNGADINTSIVKAAEEFKLNIDQTDRLLETMNTARVIAHYEKHANDRTSNCDIADKDIVHRMLFRDKDNKSTTEKKASCKPSYFADYSYYDLEEKDYRHKKPNVKVASALDTHIDNRSNFTIQQIVDKVSKHSKDLSMQRKFAEERKGMAESLLATQVTKVAYMLSSGYEPEAKYALFKVANSKKYPEAVRNIDMAMPMNIVKAASSHIKKLNRCNIIDVSSISKECSYAKEIEEGIHKVAEIDKIISCCANKEQGVKSLLKKYATIQKVGQSSGNSKKGNGGDSKKEVNPWLPKLKISGNTSSNDATSSMYDYLISGGLNKQDISNIVNPKKEKGTSLKEYVNNMRRSDIISELYSDDPILSEADPSALMDAYNTLVQTAPDVSLNKEIVRSILRQSVNSVAVSPFDAKQWADLNNISLKNNLINK